jgi:hypothetical protein
MLIIPTYNERENIAALAARIRKAAGPEPIFFVDDMEMKFKLHRNGARFAEFPIIFAERESGKSKFSAGKSCSKASSSLSGLC